MPADFVSLEKCLASNLDEVELSEAKRILYGKACRLVKHNINIYDKKNLRPNLIIGNY